MYEACMNPPGAQPPPPGPPIWQRAPSSRASQSSQAPWQVGRAGPDPRARCRRAVDPARHLRHQSRSEGVNSPGIRGGSIS